MTKLEETGIITQGAVMLFAADGQPASSYIPGCHWVGLEAVPAEYTVDYLFGTQIQPVQSEDQLLNALQCNLIWHAARHGKSASHRLLIALDALGGDWFGTRVSLGEVLGFGRERLTNVLSEIVELGYAEKNFQRANLRPEFLGQFWTNQKGGKTRPLEVLR